MLRRKRWTCDLLGPVQSKRRLLMRNPEDHLRLTRRSLVAGLPLTLSDLNPGHSQSTSVPESAVHPSLGNLFPSIASYAATVHPRLSFLEHKGNDLENWKAITRASYHQLLNYNPQASPFAAKVLASAQRDGYRQEEITFQSTATTAVPASLLIPDRPLKSKPGLVLLHDHGGFYYFGKEKMLELDTEPSALTVFRKRIYPAGPTAPAFARAGDVVLTIDAFYFGGRRLDPTSLPAENAPGLATLQAGSDEFIAASNKLGHEYESLTAKTLFMSGMTWPGILLWDDMRSVDYLLTRPEVNPDRVGCLGLSLGGFRSVHLAAFHPKIRASVVCCFMTTYAPMLRNDVDHHTWMAYVPGAAELLDLPDVATLAAPYAMLVQYGRLDPLFPLEGKQQSAEKIKRVYSKAKAADRMQARFYDAPHMLSAA